MKDKAKSIAQFTEREINYDFISNCQIVDKKAQIYLE
jgi:hypothetical protein